MAENKLPMVFHTKVILDNPVMEAKSEQNYNEIHKEMREKLDNIFIAIISKKKDVNQGMDNLEYLRHE